ncbi:unnamed protein product [Microthlaspi erraticum]|uniref:Uncharacterized protein n=1 Tax=Microthlaspi erraticum TaxID=1685480 RepID=A0A6D2IW48_9BRAS|nr:unnamed protein product [Microthlaspi erraticum]
MFRSAKYSVRLKSRPKSKTDRPITHHDPGNIARGRPRHNRHARRARPCRASREVTPRGRATRSRTTADASVRAGAEDCPHDRPRTIGHESLSRDRLFEAHFIFSRPGLTLSRL